MEIQDEFWGFTVENFEQLHKVNRPKNAVHVMKRGLELPRAVIECTLPLESTRGKTFAECTNSVFVARSL